MRNLHKIIPRATVLCREEIVITVARKAISLTCVEDQEGSPQRMKGPLNTKEVNQGQDHTAEPCTTTTPGAGLAAKGTATRVAEAIPVIDQHPQTATDHPAEATDAVQPLLQHVLLLR